jgi:phosphoglycolate phosphatase-like HAD superfamily hydrolase
VARTVVYPGVHETLATLAAEGRRMGVCTNKLQSTTLAVLRELKLDGYFDAVLGGDAVPARKPDPRHLLSVLAALGGCPEDSVMVGDNENDIAAAPAQGRFWCATATLACPSPTSPPTARSTPSISCRQRWRCSTQHKKSRISYLFH